MKAITLWQPWASLVIGGYKTFETRSWQTSHRGALAIHAAKREPRLVEERFSHRSEYTPAADVRMIWGYLEAMGYHRFADLPRGRVLGTVSLLETCPTEDLVDLISVYEFWLGDWSPGRYAWRLNKPTSFEEPIPARGRQGLWNWVAKK